MLHVRRHGRGDADRRAVFVERHHDFACMQVQAGRLCPRSAPIDAVADDRPSHGSAMHTQLMGAAGERLEREPGEVRRIAGPGNRLRPFHHSPGGDRRLTGGIMLHPPAARGVLAAEGKVDAALVLRRSARDHCPIALADASVLEQPPERRQRLAMAAEHKTAGSVAIEPMRQRRRARQPETQRVEIVFQTLAAFRPPVNRQTRRLVDHQHQAVAIDEPSYYLFRGHDHLPSLGETAITTVISSEPEDYERSAGRETKLVAAAQRRSQAHLGFDRRRCRRSCRQAQAGRGDARGDRGCVDSRRPRHRERGKIAAAVGEGRYDKSITADEVKSVVAAEVEKVLTPVAKPLGIGEAKPFVVLVVGVNGSGKTTIIGKLAAKLRAEGRSVMLAAAATFRASALDQLKIWGGRTGASVIARAPGADAAGVAFDALTEARGEEIDVLLVDTAGRLQNKAVLMDELQTIVRVMQKVDRTAPHAVLLVLDATVGQNALSQVEVFRDIAGVTGLVMTKLDGTARGGILVAIAAKYGLPVHFIGVGEGVDDLAPFSAKDFARAIAGID